MKDNETAESLLYNVDWSWGDTTQIYAWRDRLAYLESLNPELAKTVQIARDRKYESWKDYDFFWAEQRRLKYEKRRKQYIPPNKEDI